MEQVMLGGPVSKSPGCVNAEKGSFEVFVRLVSGSCQSSCSLAVFRMLCDHIMAALLCRSGKRCGTRIKARVCSWPNALAPAICPATLLGCCLNCMVCSFLVMGLPHADCSTPAVAACRDDVTTVCSAGRVTKCITYHSESIAELSECIKHAFGVSELGPADPSHDCPLGLHLVPPHFAATDGMQVQPVPVGDVSQLRPGCVLEVCSL